LWGITADGWIAIATLSSGAAVLLGIVYGARQFLREQEARDVRRYLVEEGAWKLQGSLDGLLGVIRQNYSTSLQLLRTLRDLPKGHPGAPRTEDLPRLLPVPDEGRAFEAIRPTSRLLGCEELGAVATHAYAALHSVHGIIASEVEQSIRTYYSSTTSLTKDQHAQLVQGLSDVIQKRYFEAEEWRELPGWLEDAGLRVQELRVSRFKDIGRLHKDKKVRELAKNIRDLAARRGNDGAPDI